VSTSASWGADVVEDQDTGFFVLQIPGFEALDSQDAARDGKFGQGSELVEAATHGDKSVPRRKNNQGGAEAGTNRNDRASGPKGHKIGSPKNI
jgi:hypothetical protein